VSFLDYLRDSVVTKFEGIDEQACRREFVASGTSLYWLVTHMTAGEINWFQRVFAGNDVGPPDAGPDDTMALAVRRYRAACRESRAIVSSSADLGHRSARPDRRGENPPLRWILVHMIEEVARHAGHADIIREQLDGCTGR